MDWTKFLQDNSASLFTLLGVFLGSLITFLINYTNSRFQAAENDKARQERRTESKTELRLELQRNDIRTIEESIDNFLRLLDAFSNMWRRTQQGKLSDTQLHREIDSAATDEDNRLHKLNELESISWKLVTAQGKEFFDEYRNLESMLAGYVQTLRNTPVREISCDDIDELDDKIKKQAGRLHNMLVEKLVSIRDSQPRKTLANGG